MKPAILLENIKYMLEKRFDADVAIRSNITGETIEIIMQLRRKRTNKNAIRRFIARYIIDDLIRMREFANENIDEDEYEDLIMIKKIGKGKYDISIMID